MNESIITEELEHSIAFALIDFEGMVQELNNLGLFTPEELENLKESSNIIERVSGLQRG